MQFPLNHFIPYSSITSYQATSHNVTFDLVIDKLSFRLKDKITIDDVIYHFDNNQIENEEFNSGHETGIKTESFIIFFNFKSKLIYKIVTNPNFYGDFHTYKKRFKYLLPTQLKKILKINQVDFAINFYNLDYGTFLKVLIVKKKQSFGRIKCNRNENRTCYYGSKKNQSVAYDKKFKINKSRNRKFQDLKQLNIQNLSEISDKYNHWSELEVQLSGDKLPTRDFQNFLNAIQDEEFNPFRNHYIANYRIKNIQEINPKMASRYYQIKEAINCLGLFEAKKTLNSSKNFDRDFNKIVELGNPLNLADYFHPLLKEYLSKGQNEKNHGKFLPNDDLLNQIKRLNLDKVEYSLPLAITVKESVHKLLFGGFHGE